MNQKLFKEFKQSQIRQSLYDRDTMIKNNLFQSMGFPMFGPMLEKYKEEISPEGLVDMLQHFNLMLMDEKEAGMIELVPERTICGYDADITTEKKDIERDTIVGELVSHYGFTTKGKIVLNLSKDDSETITLD